MSTLFSAILASLGLSQSEAAAFLNVRLDTVKSWSAGRNPVRAEIYAELHALAEKQRSAADAAFQSWREAKCPKQIEFALPGDAEIARRGWPSRGAFLAVAGRLWSLLPPEVELRLMPAGTTEAVRGAERLRKFTED